MKKYIIKQAAGFNDINWEAHETFSIDNYPWGGDYRPPTFAKICYIKDEGFSVHMVCKEQNPRAVHLNDGDAVCEDSCLEFFANFFPEKDTRYINFEMNANGALLCTIRNENEVLAPTSPPLTAPKVRACVLQDEWSVLLTIPQEFILSSYGLDRMKDTITANFFKCGNLTESPHYGCWSAITSPKPRFHLPEFFKPLEIEKIQLQT